MLLHNIWYFFLKIFKRNPDLKKSDFSNPSFIHKLWLILFSLRQFDSINDVRRKYFPTLHYFHSRNSNANYDLNLHFLNKLFNLIKNKNNFIFLKNNFISKNNFFNFFLFMYFLNKNFFKFFNTKFYKSINPNNLIKVFILFWLSLSKLNYKVNLLNLNKYEDWFNYNFNFKNYFFLKKNNYLKLKLNKFSKKTIDFYKYTYFSISEKLNLQYDYMLHFWSFFFDRTLLSLIRLNDSFKKLNNSYYPVRFNESSTNKFIELNKLSDYSFFFIRKNRIFNKGRYSRNRQTYRTGVYWCLWFNILSVYGLYFIFYRVTFNFGFLWLPLAVFFGSFIFSRVLKYNFFNLNYIITEINKFVIWVSLIYNDIYNFFQKLFFFYFKNFSILNNLSSKNSFFSKYLFFLPMDQYLIYLNKKDLANFESTWNSLNNSSNNFFLKL